jgi:hypothetical protein
MDLTHLAFWHWWVAAAILAILEMVMPGTLLMWFALAAGVVGLVVMVVPIIPWQAQFLLFAALSVTAIYAWRRYQAGNPAVADTTAPTLNRRGDQYIGRVVTLHGDIVNGQGKANVDDTVWRVTGPDLPAGTQVKVTGVDGATLKVEKA